MNGLTARLSLDLLKLSPGQVFAVTGAAGAYGGYVIQLAKAEGLTVIADASEKDEKLVELPGADIVVRRGDDVASRIRDIFLKELMDLRTVRCSMSASSRAFVTAAPSRLSGDSRASRNGISVSRQPLCAPTRRSSRDLIGSGNWSKRAKSHFASLRSIRRKGRRTPIAGWRPVAREDGWSSDSN